MRRSRNGAQNVRRDWADGLPAAARRGGGAALGLAALASGPDGVGAVAVDGHIGGLGSAGRTLDRNAALSGNQQGG